MKDTVDSVQSRPAFPLWSELAPVLTVVFVVLKPVRLAVGLVGSGGVGCWEGPV